MTPGIQITTAVVADAPEILTLQRLAFQSEAELCQDPTIPPLRQTLEELVEEFADRVVLKAVCAGRILGSVRAHTLGTSCYIGRLAVQPDWQGRGIGTELLEAIERCFPQVERFELFTGHRSERNLRLYQRQGYRIVREETIHAHLRLVFLEKNNEQSRHFDSVRLQLLG